MSSQRIICVTGAYSGAGKTTVAETLLKHLPGKWGALKYTKTSFYTSVKDETESAAEGKDTYRLRVAGAKLVIRIESPYEALAEAVSVAMSLLSGCDGIVAEGNSLIEFLPADVVIFVFGKDSKKIKPSAVKALQRADILVKGSINEEEIVREVLERLEKE